MDDEVWVERALDGDDQAVERLHERYVQPLFHYVYVQTGNDQDAEELIQDIFLKMAPNLGKFQGKSSFKTWIFAIGRNTVIDYHRRQRKDKGTIAMPETKVEVFSEPVLSAEDEVLQRRLKEQIMVGLQQLPVDHRTVLHLRFIEGFSIRDTAQIMSRTSLSVKALQHRAKKRLMTLLRDEVNEK